MNFEEFTINMAEKEVDISLGLSDILISWIGNKKTDYLFQKLLKNQTINYDLLEDTISRESKLLFGKNNFLRPRDFLRQIHPFIGGRINYSKRQELSFQETIIKDSPYAINAFEIKKQIKRALKEKTNQ
jgi:hypothetical protein